jgi:hypothetical protein
MMPFCDNLLPYYQDRPDRGIGACKPQSFSRFSQRDFHKAFMLERGRHEEEVSMARKRGKLSFRTPEFFARDVVQSCQRREGFDSGGATSCNSSQKSKTRTSLP